MTVLWPSQTLLSTLFPFIVLHPWAPPGLGRLFRQWSSAVIVANPVVS